MRQYLLLYSIGKEKTSWCELFYIQIVLTRMKLFQHTILLQRQMYVLENVLAYFKTILTLLHNKCFSSNVHACTHFSVMSLTCHAFLWTFQSLVLGQKARWACSVVLTNNRIYRISKYMIIDLFLPSFAWALFEALYVFTCKPEKYWTKHTSETRAIQERAQVIWWIGWLWRRQTNDSAQLRWCENILSARSDT